MNKNILLLVCALFCANAKADNGNLDYKSVWVCDDVKPNWYCDQQPEEKKEEPKQVVKRLPVTPPLKDPNQIKNAEEFRKELKRREDIAIMQPTTENIKAYLEMNQMMQQKGAYFADAWRRVVWQNPQYDYSVQNPTNNAAIRVKNESHDVDVNTQMAKIARENGFIFFFRSDCRYCHAMSPVLKQLAQQFNIELLPVSIDGAGLPDFPNYIDGRRQAAAWGVETVPALFIASKKTGDRAAIGFGVMSVSEILNRVFVLTNTKIGQTF